MKRAPAIRHLHMGCGEGLRARRPMAAVRTAKQEGIAQNRPAVPKHNGGKR